MFINKELVLHTNLAIGVATGAVVLSKGAGILSTNLATGAGVLSTNLSTGAGVLSTNLATGVANRSILNNYSYRSSTGIFIQLQL